MKLYSVLSDTVKSRVRWENQAGIAKLAPFMSTLKLCLDNLKVAILISIHPNIAGSTFMRGARMK